MIAHPGNVSGFNFSPDGTRLMTSAEDGSVVLWDTETATQVARISLPIPMHAMAGFRADGTLVLTPLYSADPAVYVWDPSTERATAFACRAAGRELTEEEWSDTFGDLPYREVCSKD